MKKVMILLLMLASSIAINVYSQTVTLDNTFGQNGKTIIPNTSEIIFFDFDNHGDIIAVEPYQKKINNTLDTINQQISEITHLQAEMLNAINNIKNDSFDYSQNEMTREEWELYNLIMEYREEKGLQKIPISKSLTYIAQVHAKDLQENHIRGTECNMHSWSDKGNWTSCCYTSDHAQAQCMWEKPQELTSYKGDGYEIAHWNSSFATPKSALNGWKNSPGHNVVIINEGIWANPWNAIGIGIFKEYAIVWFGKEADE